MARRIPAEFVPSDVNLARDPAIRSAGAMAELLYRRSLEYAKGARTDGAIPKYDLSVVGVGIPGNLTRHASALVAHELWIDEGCRWRIRSWLKWNLSQDEVTEAKDARRVGAIKTNHRKHATPDDSCPICRGEMTA